jgi:hypothetical protein
MKRIALALLLIASPAVAGGIYNDSTATAVTTEAANVEKVLWSKPISGGAISSANAMRVEVMGVTSSGLTDHGEVTLKLNGEYVGGFYVFGPSTFYLDVTMIRVTNTTAWAIVEPSTIPASPVDARGVGYISGLSWTSQQTLEVVGESTVADGLTLLSAGIER